MKPENDMPAPETPLSIDAGARVLETDRRTLTGALRSNPEIEPCDRDGVRGSPRWKLCDLCEALEIYRQTGAPPDLRKRSPMMTDADERAAAMPCPVCAGFHVEARILPHPGRRFPPHLQAWFRQHGFSERYPDAGADHDF